MHAYKEGKKNKQREEVDVACCFLLAVCVCVFGQLLMLWVGVSVLVVLGGGGGGGRTFFSVRLLLFCPLITLTSTSFRVHEGGGTILFMPFCVVSLSLCV
jgi:hypothetical protein